MMDYLEVIMILLVGILSIIYFYWICREIWYALTSINWYETSGLIVESNVKYHSEDVQSGRIGQNYHIRVSYEVDGQAYECSRLQFGGEIFGRTSDRNFNDPLTPLHPSEAKELYSKGETITVFCHPNKPELSVIRSGINWNIIFHLIVGICVLMAALGGLIKLFD